MESSLDESNNNNNKLIGEDNTQTDNINSYLDVITSSEQAQPPQKASESNIEQNINTSPRKRIISPPDVEKGQQEVESRVKELSLDAQSGKEGSTGTDEYSFTEDQKRAMMELMAQNEEDADLLDEEPPEYNVKGRLIQLNEELANDPTPLEADREHRVGFKPKIVDLVASPPPDYSDDDLHSSRIKPDTNSSAATLTRNQKKNENSFSNEGGNSSKDNISDPNKKQFVVEQDGQFFVVSTNDLKSSGNDMLIDVDEGEKKANKQSENQFTKSKTSSYNNHGDGERAGELSGKLEHSSPKPPSEQRPKSGVSGTRRSSGQSSQPRSAGHSTRSISTGESPPSRSAGHSIRSISTGELPPPKSACHSTRSISTGQSPPSRSIGQISNYSSCLSNFTYSSPYAMALDQKAIAREEAKQIENERKEKEKRHKLEEEERRRESKSAFHAWLDKKKEQEKQRQESEKQMEKSKQKEDNEDPFKVWLKEKKTRIKQERLLKKREQQEQNNWYFSRTREECEKAFKEWLKKKNKEEKKQHQTERQRNKLYRFQVKQSKKTLALIRALKEAQAFRYAEYYGYRF